MPHPDIASRIGAACGRTGTPFVILATILAAGFAATAHARTLQQVLDRQAFDICAHPDARPYSMRDPKAGGLQIDLAEALAARLGVALREEWVLMRRDARQVGCDAIMAGIAPDLPGADHQASASASAAPRSVPALPPGQALSRPYAAQLTRVVFRSGAPPIASVDDLKGRQIAVPPASFAHYLLDKRGISVRTLYMAEADILDAVERGEMDAGVVSEWTLGWYRKQHPDSRLEALDRQIIDPELDFNVAVVLRGSDQALLARINDIVGGLMSDGTVARIFATYGIPYRPPLVR
jgi:polar amino acid transport system substrate-binding protein